MKRVFQSIAIFLFISNAHAVDYFHAKITGVGILAGENRIRFTIDKDPNVVLTTDQFSGDQLARLVALVLTAYTAQSDIYIVRSAETSSSTVRHYSSVNIVSVGTYAFD